MKNNLLLAVFILILAQVTQAQVAIDRNGVGSPHSSAELDVISTDKGFLAPRVALIATNNATLPVASPAQGLIVYNTATNASVPTNAVTPGLYYYDTNVSLWVRVITGGTANAWGLTGNAATNDPAAPVTYGTTLIGATENWIGTTDAQDVVLGTDTKERMRILKTSGNIGIGTATPAQKLDVAGAVQLGTTTTATTGAVRWNTTTLDFESYDGTRWWSLTGLQERTLLYTSEGF